MRNTLDYLKEKIENNKFPFYIIIIISLSFISSIMMSSQISPSFGCWFLLIGLSLIFLLTVYQRYKSISLKEMNKSFIEGLKDDFLGFIILSLIILFIMLYGVVKNISLVCMGFVISPIIFLVIFAYTIRYGLLKIKYYKFNRNKWKYLGSIIIVILILIGGVSTIYIEGMYIFSAEGEEIYYINITQNTSANYEIILPNLVHENDENVTLNPVKYKIMNGEARIEGIDSGKFLKIESSALNLTVQFKQETYFLHNRDLKWDFQWELIKDNETEEYMNITFNPSINQGCHLTLRWTDHISPFVGGHWYDLRAEEKLTNGTNKVIIEMERSIA